MKFSHDKLSLSLVGVAAMFAANSASAALMTSISDSWHNLGASPVKTTTPNGGTTPNHSTNTGEICVFCHTPHGADNANTSNPPLWNRNISGGTTYTRYSDLGTVTFDAAEAPIGSITIGCLSCHDGTQAIDSVINKPGSGGYDPAGSPIGGFVGDDQTGGKLKDGIVQNLGTDLSNDHPVSMQYGGGGITETTTTTNDGDFRTPTMNILAASGQPRWYLPAETTAQQISSSTYGEVNSLNPNGLDRMDVILYTRTDLPGDNTPQPFVECGSCHDPHNVDNPTFLRISNSAPSVNPDFDQGSGGPSALCLTCHDK
jgi:hypothetical protein